MWRMDLKCFGRQTWDCRSLYCSFGLQFQNYYTTISYTCFWFSSIVLSVREWLRGKFVHLTAGGVVQCTGGEASQVTEVLKEVKARHADGLWLQLGHLEKHTQLHQHKLISIKTNTQKTWESVQHTASEPKPWPPLRLWGWTTINAAAIWPAGERERGEVGRGEEAEREQLKSQDSVERKQSQLHSQI